jgi:hypothetical protein
MSWFSSVRTATGGLLRHKMQAVVIAMVLLVSTASATLGFALLAASNTPFTHAFDAQHGADVTVTVNAARASSAQLAGTRTLGGVTAAAWPGVTQPSAVLVIELAKPTTTRAGAVRRPAVRPARAGRTRLAGGSGR